MRERRHLTILHTCPAGQKINSSQICQRLAFQGPDISALHNFIWKRNCLFHLLLIDPILLSSLQIAHSNKEREKRIHMIKSPVILLPFSSNSLTINLNLPMSETRHRRSPGPCIKRYHEREFSPSPDQERLSNLQKRKNERFSGCSHRFDIFLLAQQSHWSSSKSSNAHRISCLCQEEWKYNYLWCSLCSLHWWPRLPTKHIRNPR